MSRPRLLADHDLNERLRKGVLRREPALEFACVRDFGMEQRPDDEILAFAAQEGWIVVSHDVKTMSAAAQARVQAGQPMNGLLLARQHSPLAPVIDNLVLI